MAAKSAAHTYQRQKLSDRDHYTGFCNQTLLTVPVGSRITLVGRATTGASAPVGFRSSLQLVLIPGFPGVQYFALKLAEPPTSGERRALAERWSRIYPDDPKCPFARNGVDYRDSNGRRRGRGQ